MIIAIILPFPGNDVRYSSNIYILCTIQFSLFLQAPPLLLMMLIFAVYIYFSSNNDMQMSASNLLFETILLTNIIIMLTLKATNYIEESLDETLEPINDESCQSNQILTKLTLLLLVIYHLPLLIAIVYFIIQISKKHIHQMYMR